MQFKNLKWHNLQHTYNLLKIAVKLRLIPKKYFLEKIFIFISLISCKTFMFNLFNKYINYRFINIFNILINYLFI